VKRFVFTEAPLGRDGHANFHQLNMQVFGNAPYSLWYMFGVLILAIHISHGFQSAFRSLGVNHPVYTPAIEWISRLAAVVVGIGFASIPLYVLIKGV
jgi:succinate dehydrogenase / fumarate reductase cytochrome b subunit